LHSISIQPTPLSLSDYVMYMSDHIKPSSVVTYLSGIIQILEPIFPDVREVRASPMVRDTIIGCKHLHSIPIARKSPLTVEIVSAIANSTSSSYNDILFKTMLSVGFHSLLRLGDLTDPLNPALISPAKRASRLSVKSHEDSISYILPAHKADKFFKGNTILIKNLWPQIDVVRLFSIYLKIRDSRHPFSSPLWITEDGFVPNRDFFLKRLRDAGLGVEFGGQSMRAGGATALASVGVPEQAIQ
ncbi:putative retroelement protein, partial [Panaeolus papilionaceus]